MTIFVTIDHNDGGALTDYWPDSSLNGNHYTFGSGLQSTAYGLEIQPDVGGLEELDYDITPEADLLQLYLRFYVNRNNIAANGSAGIIGSVVIEDSVTVVDQYFSTVFSLTSGNVFQVRLTVNDDNGFQQSSQVAIVGSGDHKIEVFVEKESSPGAGDGTISLHVDDTVSAGYTNLENTGLMESIARISTSVATILATSHTGTWLADQFILSDDFSDSLFVPGFKITGLAGRDGRLYLGVDYAGTLQIHRVDIANDTVIETLSEFGSSSNGDFEVNPVVTADGLFAIGLTEDDGSIFLSIDRGDNYSDISPSSAKCLALTKSTKHQYIAAMNDGDVYQALQPTSSDPYNWSGVGAVFGDYIAAAGRERSVVWAPDPDGPLFVSVSAGYEVVENNDPSVGLINVIRIVE